MSFEVNLGLNSPKQPTHTNSTTTHSTLNTTIGSTTYTVHHQGYIRSFNGMMDPSSLNGNVSHPGPSDGVLGPSGSTSSLPSSPVSTTSSASSIIMTPKFVPSEDTPILTHLRVRDMIPTVRLHCDEDAAENLDAASVLRLGTIPITASQHHHTYHTNGAHAHAHAHAGTRPASFSHTLRSGALIHKDSRGIGSFSHTMTAASNPYQQVSNQHDSHGSSSSTDSPYPQQPLFHLDPNDSSYHTSQISTPVHIPTLNLAQNGLNEEGKDIALPKSAASSSLSLSSSSSSSSYPSAGSPRQQPIRHLHSTLPDSLHNPSVQLDKYRQRSGSNEMGVLPLDADDIKLSMIDENNPTSSTSSTTTPSPTHMLAELISHQPIPIASSAYTHFTPQHWRWTHIDYVNEHHDVLSDFFQALETHSDVYYKRTLEPPPPASSTTVGANATTSTTAASHRVVPPLRILPPLTRPIAVVQSDLTVPTSVSLPSSPLPPPVRSFLSIHDSLSSTASATTPSPSPQPLKPSYSVNFIPHRLETLTLHAEKSLLHKAHIVSGPLFLERNPTERLLTQTLIRCGNEPLQQPLSARQPSRRMNHPTSTPSLSPPTASSSLNATSSAQATATASSHNFLPHLRKLDIRMGIDGCMIGDGLKRNSTLTELHLPANVIAEKGCAEICHNLHQHASLKVLNLSQNILYPSSGVALRDLFLYNRALTRLDVSVNKLGTEGVATLMEAFGSTKMNRQVMTEWIEKSTMPTSAASAFVTGALATPSSIVTSTPSLPNSASHLLLPSQSMSMSMRANSPSYPTPTPSPSPTPATSFVNAATSQANLLHNAAGTPPTGSLSHSTSNSHLSSIISPSFTPSFSINQTLTSLDISNNKLSPNIAAICSSLIASNSPLRELKLGLNDIGDIGANYVALALRHPDCHLESLDLSDNSIGPFGCKVLMQSLELNSTLTHLCLSWNTIGAGGLGEGPKSIGKMLASPVSALKQLRIISNAINENAMRTIVSGWKERMKMADSAMNDVNDPASCISSSSAVSASASLSPSFSSSSPSPPVSPSPLELLDVSINPLGNDGVRELLPLLTHPSTRLQHLFLQRCSIGDDGYYSIASVLDRTPVHRINLIGNHAPKIDSLAALLDGYTRITSMVELELDDSPILARDELLAKTYRRGRRDNFTRFMLIKEANLPLQFDLCTIITEYTIDVREKIHLNNHSTTNEGED